LQQTQKNVINLRLKQDINRQLEEKQAMERERQLLLVQQQDLELKKDNRKAYQKELKIIAEKKQALDLVLKENMERGSLAMIKEEEAKANAIHERRIQLQLQEKIASQQQVMATDTMQRTLIRYLNRNLRYPEAARKNGGKGDVYSSIIMNEDGMFNDIQTYDELPSEANGHFQEIVVVSYPAKTDQPDNTSAADIKKLFMAEAERVFKKNTGIPVTGKTAPKKYFFKISFRLEQDK